MRKVYNFSPGPAMLPEEVLLQAQKEMLDWNNTGMSIMELGHRGPSFKVVAEQAEADLRELMSIPKQYHVLFMAGGASHQFAMVPLNLLNSAAQADYVDTGIWSKKAIDEAQRYGEIRVVAQTEVHHQQVMIPAQEKWSLNPEASYVHYTPNETIEGVEFQWVPKTGKVPLVADMTSFILSKPIDVNQFGVIYAGAQKNLGQAGISVVIIRDDLIREPLSLTPTLYSYKVSVDNKSLYNTPPTYAWYILGLMVAWMKKKGGIRYFAELNQRKSQKLYSYIDSKNDFYMNSVNPSCRSVMNIPFNLIRQELTDMFLTSAEQHGLTNLKGHRLAGGVRASIYNSMPEEGVDALIAFMDEFARKHSR